MATVETIDQVTFKEEFVFVDEYFPIDLHEEEVVAETLEPIEVVTEQRVNNEEIIHATNSILPDDGEEEGYDPLDPSQWAQEEVIIESSDTYIKQEYVTSAAVGPATLASQEEEQTHVYECYKCARRFNFKDKLFKHMKLHHARGDDVMIERDGKRIWTCTQCDKTFISRKGSIIHQRTHTGERPYSCSVCQKRFIDSSTLMKHQVIHQAVRPFTCLICNRGFNQKVALQRHERTHGQLQPTFKCKYCPKTFLVASSLQAHEKIHSGIKPYTCQYCPSRFHTSTAQRQHERVHTNERPYSCNYCPKAFKDSGTLFKHQVIHSGIRPFVCPICSQGFTQKVALRKHIRSHVSRNPANNCEVCETVFFTKDELCTHVEEHIEQHPSLTQVKSIATSSVRMKQVPSSPEPQDTEPAKENGDLSDLATLCDVAISTAGGHLQHTYPCLHCGMSFRRKKSLDSHLSIHRTTCKYCDRPFPDKASLETHERRLCSDISVQKNMITTNRQFPREERYSPPSPTTVSKEIYIGKNPKRFFYCERCDKTFSSRNGYIIHQRSHTGERPYPCRWCDKAFGDSATRHKHERIHTGERPFKCSRCPRAFNQRAALRAHQVTHTVDRAFLCKYCPSSFPYFATLKRHQQACHNEIACPLCSLSTNDTKKLHSHIIAKHISLVNGSLSCALCESGMFTDASEFCDHMVWHAKQQQTGNKVRQGSSIPSRMSRRQILRRKALNYTTKKTRGRAQEEEYDVEIVEEHDQIEEEEEEDMDQEEQEQEVETDPLEEEEERIQVEVEEGEIRLVEEAGEEGPVEQVIEQTVVTEDFTIVDEEFACDMCGILCPDHHSLKQHIPLHL